MTAFWCQYCHRVCCWDCLKPDDSIDEIKTAANRYCEREECRAAERASCNCLDCRAGGIGHRKATGEPCAHRGLSWGRPFFVAPP